ncbi:four-carbon acid sugar kinase family protein [Microbacterium sp. JZ101]
MTCAPQVVGIVADDATGAADAAAVFALHGWRVLLVVEPDGVPMLGDGGVDAPTVIAIATGARPQDDADARRMTVAAVRRLADAGVDRLVLKIDSTIRGSLRAQVEGGVEAWRERRADARALVAPAFPAQGRTVAGGIVYVDGVPVADTASGRDPLTPVSSSDLAHLLPGYRRLECFEPFELAADVAGVYADATTDEDLDRVAALADTDAAIVAAGSAGLASALARRWAHVRRADPAGSPARDLLVAVSSRHPASAAQLAALRDAAVGDVEILMTAEEDQASPAIAAEALAAGVLDAVRRGPVDAVISVGGDGTAAILSALGAAAVEFDGVLIVGCPTGTVIGGAAAGLRLVTKSGGFGQPDTLLELVGALRAGSRPAEELIRHTTRRILP